MEEIVEEMLGGTSAGRGPGRDGHRDDRPAPAQQEEKKDTGRAQSRTLQEALEGRAAVRLAFELPMPGVRYEQRAKNYLGFVQLGCVIVLLRYL
jgi:hypothetical protein